MKYEHCNEEFDELITRQGFCMTYFVEWVCKYCFCKIENINFEDYNEKDYYGEVQVETRN